MGDWPEQAPTALCTARQTPVATLLTSATCPSAADLQISPLRQAILLRSPAMSLLAAETFRSSSNPVRSAKLPAEAYVLSIASLPSFYAAAASAPSNSIHLFDRERLRNVITLPGHEDAITTLRSVPNVANAVSHALLSSGKDGTVKVWDERAGSAALRCKPLFCMLVPRCTYDSMKNTIIVCCHASCIAFFVRAAE